MMFDSNPLADSSPKPANSATNPSELDRRLGLYQVFLKLYEHHRELLDEILDLENNSSHHHVRGVWQYIQGVVQNGQAYLTTNLLQDKTQLLVQPQQVWVIGRDRKAGISVQDKRLSRRHAMIQYLENQGFYLIDLSSTNGTYLNGESVRRPMLLKDGDRIRLGSLSLLFFYCNGVRSLEPTPVELMSHLENGNPADPQPLIEKEGETEVPPADWETPLAGSEKETSMFLKASASTKETAADAIVPDLSTAQKSDILDRFLNR